MNFAGAPNLAEIAQFGHTKATFSAESYAGCGCLSAARYYSLPPSPIEPRGLIDLHPRQGTALFNCFRSDQPGLLIAVVCGADSASYSIFTETSAPGGFTSVHVAIFFIKSVLDSFQ